MPLTQALYQRRKEEGYWRENQKWQKEEHVYSKVETKYEQLRSSGQGGAKRGQSSEQYNIITLDYANTPGGQALKAKVGRMGWVRRRWTGGWSSGTRWGESRRGIHPGTASGAVAERAELDHGWLMAASAFHNYRHGR